MVRSMDELMDRVMRKAYRLQDLSDQLAAIRVRVGAADGAVIVVMDGTGALVDLELTEDISTLTAAEFETAIVAAAEAGAKRALEQHNRIIAEFTEATTS
ncbi:YbaB/EbfC family nucleoid-associated protein [Nocardia caishijiensis]|uniref:YbaB/EbfC DNA-binding family protein n=1 Tax=Nocardia caishijiensis TaxID=184756 RepID=A0ABQ6YR06_9NOCA|nr:YbaB/EbfC family nucleoid-associated protein [Nocardia caishijiensis]KAF0848267.1 YbaB/EbfC DNA-binding family protein [Nocardia caishijiensis]